MLFLLIFSLYNPILKELNIGYGFEAGLNCVVSILATCSDNSGNANSESDIDSSISAGANLGAFGTVLALWTVNGESVPIILQ